jgi:hypothetical protein
MDCKSGKQCFASAGAAQRVARSMNNFNRKKNRRSAGKAPARVYECEICGYYQITGAKDMKRIKVKYIPTEEHIEVRTEN